MVSRVAIIGGTGLTSLREVEITRREVLHTPYGEPSAPLVFGKIDSTELVFLPRHGAGHTIPPHRINYRANIHALMQVGVTHIIAVNAVGGIAGDMGPGRLVVPEQIIDYTYGRVHTYFEEGLTHVTHIDFTNPYCADLRDQLIAAGKAVDLDLIDYGVYGATQGPRLETTAEVLRMERDGCDLVGMTGMPEAALARELELCYACLAVVANMAAGKGEGEGEITMEEIEHHLKGGMEKVRLLLEHVLPRLV